ncbi:hypothetical protein WA026_008900 [Henosepilachna vigintioctopunctata]|uniref:Uncharacterized protein n=1 Tax=Henosepilachna vigintioctopunctata TaxID=420089 RepID=A0AAW1VDF1_9CUCU
MESNSLSKWCRICFNEFLTGIFLFGDESSKMLIRDKIKQYLGFEISVNDDLSKMICEDCYKMLDGFHRFATMAMTNQEKMGKLLLPTKNNLREIKASGDNSLLHSYLTKPSVPEKSPAKGPLHCGESDIMEEMEVRIDPMVILEYGNQDDNEIENEKCQSNDSSDSEAEYYSENKPDENTYIVMPPNFRIDSSKNYSNDSVNREMSDDEDVDDDYQSDIFDCKICGKKMSTKGNLKVHLTTHRPKGKYECDICRRIFKTQCNLYRHKEYHGGIQFPCVVCGRVYPTNSTLRAHSITHSDLRPHKCPLCEKTFKRNQDLKFHINQHTGARPYQCPYCPKAFASSGNCFSHRKRMHPLEVERDRGTASKSFR